MLMSARGSGAAEPAFCLDCVALQSERSASQQAPAETFLKSIQFTLTKTHFKIKQNTRKHALENKSQKEQLKLFFKQHMF